VQARRFSRLDQPPELGENQGSIGRSRGRWIVGVSLRARHHLAARTAKMRSGAGVRKHPLAGRLASQVVHRGGHSPSRHGAVSSDAARFLAQLDKRPMAIALPHPTS